MGGTTNPYGTSKYMVEQILTDVAKAEPQFSIDEFYVISIQ